MTIKVKSRHILQGKQVHASGCPIALAVRELFPEQSVTVTQDRITVWGTTTLRGHTFVTPRSVRTFVREFDYSGKGEPFQFTLQER